MVHTILAAQRRRVSIHARRIAHWGERSSRGPYSEYCPAQSWTPSVNLCEHERHYCLIVELSGMAPDRIDLRVEDNVLVLSGDRPAPEPPDVSDLVCLHLMEIDHGAFCRALELPGDVDVEAIQAKYQGGYLWIRMPKKERRPA